jgi:sugar phosphate isomerase/epimerase
MGREICLAAGMLTDVADPLDRITIAADAGFDGLGLRVDDQWPTTTDPDRIRDALEERALVLLDVELAMFTSDGRHNEQTRRALSVARELRPRHFVTVCFDDDRARLVTALRALVHELDGTNVRPVIEFLPFSSVRTLDEARSIVDAVENDGSAGVLVDVLHLIRSGGSPADLADVPPTLLPYLQVCDAGPGASHPSRGELFREATGGRLLPGHGTLPVESAIMMFPAGTPISVEVLSEDLMRNTDPQTRARLALVATRATLQNASRAGPIGGSTT